MACNINLPKINFKNSINLGGENTHLNSMLKDSFCCYSWWFRPAMVVAGTSPTGESCRHNRPVTTHSLSLVQTLFRGSLSRWLRLETIAGSPPSSPAPIEHRHGHHRSDPSLLAPTPFLSLSARATAVAWPYPGVAVACRRPTTAPLLSLSLFDGGRRGRGLENPPSPCVLSQEERGSAPFCPFPLFFVCVVLAWFNNSFN